jgi:hypothetical protein
MPLIGASILRTRFAGCKHTWCNFVGKKKKCFTEALQSSKLNERTLGYQKLVIG